IGTAALDHESWLTAMESQAVVKPRIDQIDKVLDRVRCEFAKQADGNCSLTGLHHCQRVLLCGIGTGWGSSRLRGGGTGLATSRLRGGGSVLARSRPIGGRYCMWWHGQWHCHIRGDQVRVRLLRACRPGWCQPQPEGESCHCG